MQCWMFHEATGTKPGRTRIVTIEYRMAQNFDGGNFDDGHLEKFGEFHKINAHIY